jgi:peptide/nickel transport system permease protein
MSAPIDASAPAPPRPRPRIDQMKRTWYFFRRNTLGMVGLAIILAIAGFAGWSATLHVPWTYVPVWCATDYGPYDDANATGYPGNFTQICPLGGPIDCTYENYSPPNAAQFCQGLWYKTPVYDQVSYASIIAPTVSLSTLNGGPLPLGALTTSSTSREFYNTAGMLERGSDWSLFFSVTIVGLGASLGLLVGAIAGFYGGYVDEALMRFVDIFLSIPVILFVIVVISVLEVGLPVSLASNNLFRSFLVIIGFAGVWWPFYARIVRGQVLTVREQKFVEAARASGASRGRILFRHIIPNSVYPVLIQFSLDVGTIPLLIGSLAFLGFSSILFVNSPFPEWGSLSALSVGDLQNDFLTSCFTPHEGCIIPWWQLFFPGMALFFFAISVNLLADGLRDAWDPRLRR